MLSKVTGVGCKSWDYLINMCAMRAAKSLGGVILTSELYVDADVMAALSILGIVNEFFVAQMWCFLTI